VNLDIIWQNLPYLALGLRVTLVTTVLVMVGGCGLGALLALARMSGWPGLKQAAILYIELIRGMPLLVVLFLVYFGVPPLTGVHLAAWPAAVIGFIAFIGPYIAEDLRAGLEAVPPGLAEAARALGLRPRQVLRLVVLPLALRRVIGPLFGEFVRLLKFTAVASVIGVSDLTGVAIEINARAFQPAALIGTLAVVYFVCCFALSQIGRFLTRRYAIIR
jgi:His/Glu/Gln/Arg/opine family amino acid ABC transporter permease subunit